MNSLPEEKMLIRHWDPKGEYEGAGLTAYDHWVLEVSWQQHTLGCFILFCRREGATRYSELTIDELAELKTIMGGVEFQLSHDARFCPDRFNYLQLGNVLPQLHIHGVPRYDSHRSLSQEILDRAVTDAKPKSLPRWTRESITRVQMESLRTVMRQALGLGTEKINKAPRENPFWKGLREAMKSP